MGYQLTILPTAVIEIGKLSKTVREGILKRLEWLKENSEVMIHHVLVGMPPHLSGLCKLRSGDWRILYWKDSGKALIEVFAVRHRSEAYRKL